MTPLHRIGRAAAFLVAATLGGAAALGGAALFGQLGGDTTTIREVTPQDASSRIAQEPREGLTINQIFERTKAGVVQINSRSVVETVQPDPYFGLPFGFPEEQQREALGSGFVIDKAGHIVTNFHVVEGAREVSVSFSNQDRVRARVVGVDRSTDIAVLKIETESRALQPLALGDSDGLRVGDPVVAIGNPFGLERSVSAGIVSALARPLQAPNQAVIDQVIQTDAAINEGSSGGPLLDASGQVVGVTTAIATAEGSTGNVGIGFAVPIDTVKDVAAKLIEHGRVDRAYLGVRVLPIDEQVAELFRLPVDRGLIIQDVTDGSAADEAGLNPGTTQVVVAGETYVLGGDIILSLDGEELESGEDLRDALARMKPGDEVELEIVRGEDRERVVVTLGRQPRELG